MSKSFTKQWLDQHFLADKNLSLTNTSTQYPADFKGLDFKKELRNTRKKLGEWQDKLYAHNKYAVLVCIQGMDTSGKDSLIRELFKDFNSRGVVVHSYKTPSKEELEHDYLWRHYIDLPERGKFAVFNRTHYENVLVTRVHPEYLLNENLPQLTKVEDLKPEFWERRFTQINNFEEHITQNGIILFKFFLHISKEEQKNRLLRRLRKEEKNWKFSPGDIEERKLWDTYQAYYQEAIQKTSKPKAPWYVIPSDDKQAARYIIAQILYQNLIGYTDVQEPQLPVELIQKLEEYIKALDNE